MSAFSRRGLVTLLVAFGGYLYFTRSRGSKTADALYSVPLAAPEGPLQVYHLGHSLVGRDMPAMLAQLAGDEHLYHSQSGWGTSLREHWEPDLPINGFDASNDHPAYRPAREALSAGTYDCLVLTEMVELHDAVRYHDSAAYLAQWADLAWRANPGTRIYLYETWHHTNDPQGWRPRLELDYEALWRARVLHPALDQTDAPIYVIPAGQAMGAFVDAVLARGGVEGVTRVEDLFARKDDGTPDTIHMGDLGAYLVALTHFAVLYHTSPVGLPHRLARADGSEAKAPSVEAALLMQQIVWDVVTRHPETGVAA